MAKVLSLQDTSLPTLHMLAQAYCQASLLASCLAWSWSWAYRYRLAFFENIVCVWAGCMRLVRFDSSWYVSVLSV